MKGAANLDLRKHPMYRANDLRELREKGFSDLEIQALWDRDQPRVCMSPSTQVFRAMRYGHSRR